MRKSMDNHTVVGISHTQTSKPAPNAAEACQERFVRERCTRRSTVTLPSRSTQASLAVGKIRGNCGRSVTMVQGQKNGKIHTTAGIR